MIYYLDDDILFMSLCIYTANILLSPWCTHGNQILSHVNRQVSGQGAHCQEWISFISQSHFPAAAVWMACLNEELELGNL